MPVNREYMFIKPPSNYVGPIRVKAGKYSVHAFREGGVAHYRIFNIRGMRVYSDTDKRTTIAVWRDLNRR